MHRLHHEELGPGVLLIAPLQEVETSLPSGLLVGAHVADHVGEAFQRLMNDNGVTCSMSRSGNVWDNAAMESFFSSLKTERIARKTYRTRDHAKAKVFEYIERFYNPTRRDSTLGYLSPIDFERQAVVA
jgi:putative transposase